MRKNKNEPIMETPAIEPGNIEIIINELEFPCNCSGVTWDTYDETNILDRILANYSDEELMVADGLDNAVIGIDEMSMRLIYSVSKCIDIFIDEQGMTHEEALEWFSFNTEGSYVGEKTPIWCHDEY